MDEEYIPLEQEYDYEEYHYEDNDTIFSYGSSLLYDDIEYCYGLCELYHPALHDYDEERPYMNGQFLMNYFITPDEFMSNEYITISQVSYFEYVASRVFVHPTIRNYSTYQEHPSTYDIQFLRVTRLPTDEYVVVKLTYLLSILQRKWRKYYTEKMKSIYKRANPLQLKYRLLYGKWSSSCKMPVSPLCKNK